MLNRAACGASGSLCRSCQRPWLRSSRRKDCRVISGHDIARNCPAPRRAGWAAVGRGRGCRSGVRNQYRVTMPKFPPPQPVCAHHSSRFGSVGSRVANHALGGARTVHHDDFDAVQVVHDATVQPGQGPYPPPRTCPPMPTVEVRPAGMVTPQTLREGAVHVDRAAHRVRWRSGALFVVAHRGHLGQVDEHPGRGGIDEVLQTVAAAAGHHPGAGAHRVLDSPHHLRGSSRPPGPPGDGSGTGRSPRWSIRRIGGRPGHRHGSELRCARPGREVGGDAAAASAGDRPGRETVQSRPSGQQSSAGYVSHGRLRAGSRVKQVEREHLGALETPRIVIDEPLVGGTSKSR